MCARFFPFPRSGLDGSIPTRFAEQVARFPDRIAIRAGDESITYRELGRTAQGVARALLTRCGPAPEAVVLLLDQGPPLITAALGVLAAGKYYVPLDPAHPRAHLLALLEDARPRLIVTDNRYRDLASRLTPAADRILALDDIVEATGATCPLPSVAPDALAYVFYTSGSTGRPKGVMDTHRNVLHNVMRYANSLRITADDRLTLLGPPSCSSTVSDTFGALLLGAALCPVDIHREDLSELPAWITREGLTIYHSTPAIFRHIAMSAVALPSLRVVRLEGDTASPRDVDLFRTRCATECVLVNGLGLTECGLVRQYVVTTSMSVDAPVPVGYPVEDMTVALLDAAGREVPAGDIGEIVVESPFLALGYWGQPELTAQRFSSPPDRPEVRRYRTGDLGRLRADGCLEHLGRTDSQPKVRGHRVDTEGIEAALLELSAVSEAAVMVRADDSAEPRLVAYCVATGDPPPTVSMLRRHLAEQLPRDLLPATYVWLDRLPLTDNGKVDRRRLPAPGRARPSLAAAMVGPRSPGEAALARLWAEVLGLDEVGVDDDFFDLGGDSLQATHLVGRLRASFGTDLGVPTLFANPTVASIAALIAAEPAARTSAREATSGIPRRDGSGPFPLSFPQERLWILSQLDRGEPVYHVPLAMRLRGSLAVEALGEAIDAVVARHEVLRTTIQVVDGMPMQRIEPPRPIDLTVVDLTTMSEASGVAELQRRLREETRHPFDVSRDPMLRASLFRLATDEHVLLLVLHHIATDGWSEGVLLAELSALYEAGRRGQPLPLAAPPIRYVDYAVWQRGSMPPEQRACEVNYWRRRLAGVPASLDLPRDGTHRLAGSAAGASESTFLPSALVEALLRASRAVNGTLFMTLLAAFKVVLQRYTGSDDILVGTAMAGRTQPETERLVGFFVNTLPLRTDLSGDPTFREIVARVREASLEAHTHQDLPFESLIAELNPERLPGRPPLIQVAFVLEPPLPPFAPAGLSSEPVHVHAGVAAFELTLYVMPVDGGLRAMAEYRTALYDAPTIAALLGHWRTLLEAAAVDPERRLSELPILSGGERDHLLVTWNDTQREYPGALGLDALFEAQVARAPDATAVVDGDRTATYQALDEQANEVAGWLGAQGVQPGARVGIALDRSLEFIVAVLGVIKAGAAYVPLDPSQPRERLAVMLADAGVTAIVTRGEVLDRLPAGDLPVLRVDGDEPRRPAGSGRMGHRAAGGESLAYVLYTSGSTGRPKGVAVPHRAVSRLVLNTDYVSITPADVIAHVSSVAFDAATFEIWGALLNGARVVVLPAATVLSPAALAAALDAAGVTLLFLTTALFNQVAREAPGALRQLRCVMFGGESAEPRWVRAVLEAGPPARLLHMYGPTEATTFASWHRVTSVPDDATTIPIGRPIGNTRLYLLDPHLDPVPVGVPGEICIGGPGLAQGYFGRPDLTAERFVGDPWGDAPGATLYRSGDRARYRRDGTIEFLGRLDRQVKLRGHRVEPQEVESVLMQHPTVQEVAVEVWEPTPGEKELVAYVVATSSGGGEADLRGFLAARLPGYMIPAHIVSVEAFPLTANGKLDRGALPPPTRPRQGVPDGPMPARSPLEHQIVDVWERLLGVAPIGVEDDFFALGGHSLLAARMLHEVEGLCGTRVSLTTLFDRPTIDHLARTIVQEAAEVFRTRVSTLQAAGSRPPFFMLHGDFTGGGFYGRSIAEGLGPEQPFFVLHPHGLDGRPVPSSIEAMAVDHLEAVRAAQPHGPYFLGGHCNGGLIAFEMARRLRQAGESVALLVVMDASAGPRRFRFLHGLSDVLGALRGLDPDQRRDAFLRARRGLLSSAEAGVAAAVRHAGRLVRSGPRAQAALLGRLTRALRHGMTGPPRSRRSQAPGASGAPDALEHVYQRVLDAYIPRRYGGAMTLFVPAEDRQGPEDLGWRRVAASVTVREVPGNHLTSITRHVGSLTSILRECIDTAQCR